jgi:Fuc2NAc and GlcNAc transferase
VNHQAILGCALLLAMLVAWLITGCVSRYAVSKGMLDIPNARSSHTVPTARGGGIAIVVVFLISILILAYLGFLPLATAAALELGGAAIAAVGHLDDRHALPAAFRFGVHLAAVVLVVVSVGGVSEYTLRAFGLHGAVAGGIAGVLILAWTTNLFNFMDGIDGIAGGEAVFIAAAGAWLNWLQGGAPGLSIAMLALAAAASGFLIWNWPPARIFMGDVGSGFLGFSLGALGLASSRQDRMPIEVWAILGGVFLVDATLTLVRRAARGDRWFEAHRMHAYQHLASRFDAHLPVTALVIFVDLFWLLPWAYLAANTPERASWCMAAALIPLGAAVLAAGAGGREKSRL